MSANAVALVTGAGRGIGAAVVGRLVARDYHVYALDSCRGEDSDTTYPLATRADLDAVADSAPGLVTPVVADVRDVERLRDVVVALQTSHGRLDTVVAGAAVIAGGAPLWETPPEVLKLLWQTDAIGVWNTALATVPLLLKQERGRTPSFVAIASAAGENGLPHLTAYCMVKHAVIGLMRGLAADLRDSAVCVCAVTPGATSTEMLAATADLYGLQDASAFASTQAIGRLLSADEVASVVEFACTAGPVVHGSVVPAGGGFQG